ncbi:MAG: hypothetical protein OXT74_15615 [Candidatus Poribacteria bacterium]|nr:hypothetical protein [Candidatus Poribacteria bacterium]
MDTRDIRFARGNIATIGDWFTDADQCEAEKVVPIPARSESRTWLEDRDVGFH